MAEFRIETERLVLREWREADAVPLLAMEQDPRVMAFLGPLGDETEARRIVTGQTLNQREFGHCFWAIERREDQAFLGFCGVQNGPHDTPLEGRTEIGWRLAHHAWGQGYACEAAEASLAWSFANLPDDAVFAVTVPANTRSWGLMERLGMVHRPELDFDHPQLAADDPLLRHLTYWLTREMWNSMDLRAAS